jgi:molecular chaperone DnaK
MAKGTIDYGIYLGTGYAQVAVLRGTQVEIIKNNEGFDRTPAAVWIDKRGDLFVGQRAKERLGTDLGNAFSEFGLQIGRATEYRFERSGRVMRPEELTAEILKSLKADVKQRMGTDLQAAVITVPAAFELPQCDATTKAAQLAGITHSPLLQEPVAAAMAYGFHREGEGTLGMVYGLHGGGFETAVVQAQGGSARLVNRGGDSHLGARSVTWAIVEQMLIPALVQTHPLADFRRGNPKWRSAVAKLRAAAEEARVKASSGDAASIWIGHLCQDDEGQPVEFEYTLKREAVERLTEPIVLRSIAICREMLAESNLAIGGIAKIMLVGQDTRDEVLRRTLSDEVRGLGLPVDSSIDPGTALVTGAALFAGTLRIGETVPQTAHPPHVGARIPPPAGSAELRLPRSIGIALPGNRVVWLIKKDAPLPAQGQIRLKTACDVRRGQAGDVIRMPLVEGESEQADANQQLGTIEVTAGQITRDVPADSDVELTITVTGTRSIEIQVHLPLLGETFTQVLVAGAAQGPDPESLRADAAREKERLKEARRRLRDTRLPQARQVIRRIDEERMVRDIDALCRVATSDPQAAARCQGRLRDLRAALDRVEEMLRASEMQGDEPRQAQPDAGDLNGRVKEAKERLKAVRRQAREDDNVEARQAVRRIDEQRMVRDIDSLCRVAASQPGAAGECDRRLLELGAALDEAEEALLWASLDAEVEAAIAATQEVVYARGTSEDVKSLMSAEADVRDAIGNRHPDAQEKLDALRALAEQVEASWLHRATEESGEAIAVAGETVRACGTPDDQAEFQALEAGVGEAIEARDHDVLREKLVGLRELGDRVEEAWRLKAMEKAEEAITAARETVQAHGTTEDQATFQNLDAELRTAIESRDSGLLRGKLEALLALEAEAKEGWRQRARAEAEEIVAAVREAIEADGTPQDEAELRALETGMADGVEAYDQDVVYEKLEALRALERRLIEARQRREALEAVEPVTPVEEGEAPAVADEIKGKVESLEQRVANEKERLKAVRRQAREVGDPQAQQVIQRIDDKRMVRDIDALCKDGVADSEAAAVCDSRLLELIAALDQAEEYLAWAPVASRAKDALADAEESVRTRGTPDDWSEYQRREAGVRDALKARDTGLLEKRLEALHELDDRVDEAAALRDRVADEKERLKEVRRQAREADDVQVLRVIQRVDDERMVREIDALCRDAVVRPEAVTTCDTKLLELKAAIDEAEGGLEWAAAMAQAQQVLAAMHESVRLHGTPEDQALAQDLDSEAKAAMDARNSGLLQDKLAAVGQLHERVEQARKQKAETEVSSRLKVLDERVMGGKERLKVARRRARETNNPEAQRALQRIDNERMVRDIDALRAAAATDLNAVDQCEQRLLGLERALDEAGAALAWTSATADAKDALSATRQTVRTYGTLQDWDAYQKLEADAERATTGRDKNALRIAAQGLRELGTRVQDSWQRQGPLAADAPHLAPLVAEMAREKQRLEMARQKLQAMNSTAAARALAEISDGHMMEELDVALNEARRTPSAASEFGVRLNSLRMAISKVEDAVSIAEENRYFLDGIAALYGNT